MAYLVPRPSRRCLVGSRSRVARRHWQARGLGSPTHLALVLSEAGTARPPGKWKVEPPRKWERALNSSLVSPWTCSAVNWKPRSSMAHPATLPFSSQNRSSQERAALSVLRVKGWSSKSGRYFLTAHTAAMHFYSFLCWRCSAGENFAEANPANTASTRPRRMP
jgi:hypothetical protein